MNGSVQQRKIYVTGSFDIGVLTTAPGNTKFNFPSSFKYYERDGRTDMAIHYKGLIINFLKVMMNRYTICILKKKQVNSPCKMGSVLVLEFD